MIFETPISLSIIKNTKGLENLGLIKQPRLAVMKIKKQLRSLATA